LGAGRFCLLVGTWSGLRRTEGVYDDESVDLARCLKVLAQENLASGLSGSANHQGVPKGKSVKPVEVDGRQNVGEFGYHDMEFSEQFGFAASCSRIDAQLASGSNKVFLQNLKRNHAGSGAAVLGDQIEGAALFRRSSFIVGIGEDVCIEEATNGHGFRFDRSASPWSDRCRKGA